MLYVKKIKTVYALIFLIVCVSCTPTTTKYEPALTSGYDPQRLSRIRELQQALVDEGITGSNVVLVYKDGEVIYNNIVNSGKTGDAAITDETLFPIWSMTKPITTIAAMILYEEDRFLLDEPVKNYLPEMGKLICKDEKEEHYECKNTLTIRHLLSHRSGWSYYPEEINGEKRLISDTPYIDLEDFSRKTSSIPLSHEPGMKYTYGVNTALVGRLIEVLSGQSLYEFLKERIFDPLEMYDTKFHLSETDREYFQPLFHSADGVSGFYKKEFDELSYREGSKVQLGGEGLISTLKDYSHFCEMLVNGGVYKGKRIISPTTLALTIMPHTPMEESGISGFSLGFTFRYLEAPAIDGFLSPRGIFGWSGYHNTHFWIDPTNKLFGLFMTRTRSYTSNIRNRFRRAVYQAIH